MTPTSTTKTPTPDVDTTAQSMSRNSAGAALAGALLLALAISFGSDAHALDAPILPSLLVAVILGLIYGATCKLIVGNRVDKFLSWRSLAIMAVTVVLFAVTAHEAGEAIFTGALAFLTLRWALGCIVAAFALGAFARIDKALRRLEK